MTRVAVEKRLAQIERQADAASRRADAEQAPDWLHAALSAASVAGLMRVERMLLDWPPEVPIPPAAVFAALDLERRP